MRRGRYYLARVIKLGELDHEKLLNAIQEPPIITVGQFSWTFTDTVDKVAERGFIFSHLSKYTKEGHVTVIDTDTKSQKDTVAENLLVASSPFVYFPEYSGIAYLHVWAGIEESVFRRRFKLLIEEAHDNFFVDCEVEPITDYQAFVSKLTRLEKFSEIHAKVYPPNPLFGDLWEDLKEYIKSRNASEVQLVEKSEDGDGLYTELIDFVNAVVEGKIDKIEKQAPLTDAAILMAADGYGTGKVVGVSNNEDVVVRTSDTQKSFLFEKDPNPDDLAEEARSKFASISDERDMQH